MRYGSWTALTLLAGFFFACETAPQHSPRGFSLPEGNAQRGQQAFVELKCYSCHEVDGLEDTLPAPTASPQTDVVLGGLSMREPTDGELVTSIINASHQLYPGGEEERVTTGDESRMADYNEMITIQQVIDRVAFLQAQYKTAGESQEN